MARHSLSYTESIADKRRKEKDQIQHQLQSKINTETHLRLVSEKSLRSEVLKRPKIGQQITTFEDLHRHMQTKHKDYSLAPEQKKQIIAAVQ